MRFSWPWAIVGGMLGALVAVTAGFLPATSARRSLSGAPIPPSSWAARVIEDEGAKKLPPLVRIANTMIKKGNAAKAAQAICGLKDQADQSYALALVVSTMLGTEPGEKEANAAHEFVKRFKDETIQGPALIRLANVFDSLGKNDRADELYARALDAEVSLEKARHEAMAPPGWLWQVLGWLWVPVVAIVFGFWQAASERFVARMLDAAARRFPRLEWYIGDKAGAPPPTSKENKATG